MYKASSSSCSNLLLISTSILVLMPIACEPDSVTAVQSKLRGWDGCPAASFRTGLNSSSALPPADCPVDTQDTTYLMIELGARDTSRTPRYPTFSGQTLSFDDVMTTSNSYSACPDVLLHVAFDKFINGQIEHFQTVGQAYKLGPLSPLSDGLDRATYQLPDQTVYSRDGKFYAFGGTVSVLCGHGEFDFANWLAYGFIYVNVLRVYNYTGTVRVSGILQSGGTSGWSYRDNGSGFQNGSGDGWVDALNTYLSGGGCTPLWDIYVDGMPVCQNGSRVNAT